ncbi:hypothetical protein P24_09486 [Oceanibaculum indicum P24]|uniref:Uncharacterized protein n=1 Tax=Oceanibaculum indicum P24 TaxID=1207063 RepID=K2IZ55_9PROT|nr:hypothetical protein P24_09486 [Oceanibaculum indicum P24]
MKTAASPVIAMVVTVRRVPPDASAVSCRSSRGLLPHADGLFIFKSTLLHEFDKKLCKAACRVTKSLRESESALYIFK